MADAVDIEPELVQKRASNLAVAMFFLLFVCELWNIERLRMQMGGDGAAITYMIVSSTIFAIIVKSLYLWSPSRRRAMLAAERKKDE